MQLLKVLRIGPFDEPVHWAGLSPAGAQAGSPPGQPDPQAAQRRHAMTLVVDWPRSLFPHRSSIEQSVSLVYHPEQPAGSGRPLAKDPAPGPDSHQGRSPREGPRWYDPGRERRGGLARSMVESVRIGGRVVGETAELGVELTIAVKGPIRCGCRFVSTANVLSSCARRRDLSLRVGDRLRVGTSA